MGMEISPLQAVAGTGDTGLSSATAAKPAAGFADMLTKAIGQLQSVSDTTNQKVNAMATGQDVDLSSVMLSLENESLTMSLATTVRNKAVEAYQEIFRMQM